MDVHFRHHIRRIARAARIGNLATINHILDGMSDGYADQVTFGRADADREMRRDPPLPQLVECEYPTEADRPRLAA